MTKEVSFPQIYPVACHTDHVGPGTIFVAIKGYNENGINYVSIALKKGATVVVIQQDEVIDADLQSLLYQYGIVPIRVENTRLALAQLSARAANYPAKKLRILAVTGTKGKTTSAFVLEHVLRTAGYKTALMGTVKNSIGDTHLGTGLTTQQPDYLHQFFKLCVNADVDYVVMEVAAQALTLHRIHGIEFDGIIFTNFSQEHAEFYPSLDDYFAAKCLIFRQLKAGAPVLLNADDGWCKKLLANNETYTSFGVSESAQFKGTVLSTMGNGIKFAVSSVGNSLGTMACPNLIGNFNVYNLLGVTALCYKIGISVETIANAFKTFSKVPGRLERYPMPNGACAIIDYAHNPSSFESVLSTLRMLTPKLVVVFGCGGDRDKSKRPMMGRIAANYADLVVVTADNPRSEDPLKIMDEIVTGIDTEKLNNVVRIIDRKQAIEYAYAHSTDQSIIALLGKGPDEYQIVGAVKSYFSEAAIIKELAEGAEAPEKPA